jgi:TolA-binding protein
VAEDGKDKERRAEAHAAWAEALEKTNPADAKPKHRAAAADFAAAAASAATPAGRAAALRRALTHFRQAGASGEALDTANALLVLKDAPAEDVGQAWLAKAELLPPAETAAVTEALQKAMAAPGPAASSARLRLAVHHLTRGRHLLDAAPGSIDPAKAKQSGEQMVKLGRDMLVQIADAANVTPPERSAHEEAVFQLGSQLMTEAKFADAEARFRKQVQLYPDGKLVGYGRLWLACCLVQQGHTGGPADKRLQEAIDLLSPLLASPVEFLRTQAEIRTLNTLVVQQRYADVVKLGDDLAKKYKGRPDELVIGKLLFYAHLNRTPAEPGEALRVLLRMEEAFKEIPSAAFPADPEYSHARWQKDLPALRQELEKRKQ